MAENEKPWYAAGLHFECTQCGCCCSGPDQGFIWVSREEIGFIAEYLKLSEEDFKARYTFRFGPRTSLIEAVPSNDCIFLEKTAAGKQCRIYPVRPNQCRTWPFWSGNLTHPNNWNRAAQKCPGVNRGRKFSLSEILARKEQNSWWKDK
jgi:Fe-S-cluster containining protein